MLPAIVSQQARLFCRLGAASILALAPHLVEARVSFDGGPSGTKPAGDSIRFSQTGPPTISARVTPAPNAAGWNNTDVTVTFTCTNANFCPPPVVLGEETSGQTVSGTAVNGNDDASVSMIVKIDRTPPYVVVTWPALDSVVSIATVTLTGVVSDELSGMASARCNGISVAPTAAVECNVPLKPGRNSLVLSALDLAGNSASAGLRVMRSGPTTSLTITPAARTMIAGEARALAALDEYGQRVTTATWTSDNSLVGEVGEVDGVLRAVASGQAMITASVGDSSATLRLTVVAGSGDGSLPHGTTAWAVTPSSVDSFIVLNVPANLVSEESPALFVGEAKADGSSLIRALSADGAQHWVESLPTGTFVFGGFADAFGGFVAPTFGSGGAGLMRSGDPSAWIQTVPLGGTTCGDDVCPPPPCGVLCSPSEDVAPWRYETTAQVVGAPSQASNGTIFVDEYFYHDSYWDVQIAAIDGRNGRLLFRVPLPDAGTVTRDIFTTVDYVPTEVNRIAVGSDGTAYVQVKTYNEVQHWEPQVSEYVLVSRRVESSVRLLTIGPDGGISWRDLEHHLYEGPSSAPGNVWLGTSVADPGGGVITTTSHSPSEEPAEYHLTRVADGSATTHSIGEENRLIQLVGEDGTVLLRSDQSISAIDAVSGSEKWRVLVSDPPFFRVLPVAALSGGGGLAYNHSTATLMHISADGQVVESQALGLTPYADVVQIDDNALLGVDPSGSLVKVVTSSYADRTFAPSATGQNTAVKPVIVTVAPLANYGPNDGSTFTGREAGLALRSAVNLQKVALNTLTEGRATLFSYLDAVGTEFPGSSLAIRNAQVQMVGFIGHSIERADLNTTVGLQFSDRDLIKQRLPLLGEQWTGNPPGREFYVDKIHSQAKIIFVGSCFLGADFLSLWDITASTPDRVLVVPENPNLTADLYVSAKFAWPAFSAALSRGKTVDEAIVAANDSCVVQHDPDNPNDARPICGISAVTWRKVGGTNVIRLVPR
jgi:hypothetical protein